MKKILSLLLITAFIFSGCKKELNAPSCIRDKITAIQLSSTSYTTQVDEYQFKNMQVFVFREDGIADGMSPVYDNHCNQVCQLGGLAGNTTCMGEDFNTKAVYVRTVWKR